MVPLDYYQFWLTEHSLRGKNFANLNNIQNQLDNFFASKPAGFHITGIEKLHGRWQKVIENNGHYVIVKIYVFKIEFLIFLENRHEFIGRPNILKLL